MQVESFNQGWEFWTRENPEYRKKVTLPHDAMLYEKRVPYLVGGEASGYFPGGYYYYEKKIMPNQSMLEKEIQLEFDGVYQKSKVYLNKEYVGGHTYGYSQFRVNLTGKLLPDRENVILVEVDNTQIPNSRWYTGSGIYREVNLISGNREHIVRDGIRVKTNSIEKEDAILTISVRTTLEEKGEIALTISDAKGQKTDFECVNSVLKKDGEFEIELLVKNAKLWCEKQPHLYQMKIILWDEKNNILDEDKVVFGIRTVELIKEKGMCINGLPTKLKGACVHHDNGLIGACEYRETAYRRIRILKECGYNAVRFAHNPASRVMLDVCDELGIYVMEELTDVWEKAKNSYDYSLYFKENWRDDMERMVEKAYSHPSVILYSIGNEVYDVTNIAGIQTNKEMVEFVKKLDSTRLVMNCIHILTNAKKPSKKPISKSKFTAEDIVNPKREGKPSPLVSSKLMNIISAFLPNVGMNISADKFIGGMKKLIEPLDILGINYGAHLSEEIDEKFKDIFVIHSETYPSRIGKTWPNTMNTRNVIGDFMWTGWDYLGEAGIGVPQYGKERRMMNKPYPCICGGVGSVNLVGEMEAQGAYTKAVFGCIDIPYIGVRPVNHSGEKLKMSTWRGTDAVNNWSWSGCEGKSAIIEVYSRGTYVELLQDGKSLGVKSTEYCKATYETTYKPGKIMAKAFDREKVLIGESYLETASEQTQLTIMQEEKEYLCEENTTKRLEVFHIKVAITDEKGIVKVMENKKIRVTVENSGELIGIGSGNPITEECYTGTEFTTYHGTMMAVIRRKNNVKQDDEELTVRFETDGLEPVSIKL